MIRGGVMRCDRGQHNLTQQDMTGRARVSIARRAAPQRKRRRAGRRGTEPCIKKKMFQRQYDSTQHNRFFLFFLFVDKSTQAQLKQINQQWTRPITYHQTSGAANLFSDKIYERVSQNLSVLPAFNPLCVRLY